MLTASCTVLREFLYALVELVLALPRHAIALLRRDSRLQHFSSLPKVAALDNAELPAVTRELKSIFISVGDQSGQAHALKIITLLRQRHPNLKISGFGSDEMQAQGVEVILPLADLNIMGFRDVLLRLPLFFRAIFSFTRSIKTSPPDMVLLIDYPGLNRHLLRIAKRHNICVVDYIVPQLWAWAPWRVADFKRADALLSILPFEAAWYQSQNAKAHFVGHPIADELPPIHDNSTSNIVALLPGSRRREIKSNLPIMLEAAQLLQKDNPQLKFILPHSRPQLAELINDIIKNCHIDIELSYCDWHQRLTTARAAWVVSGTASLEVAAMGIPAVIVYQINSKVGAWLAKNALAVPFIGGINLIANQQVFPELVGKNLNPADLCREMTVLLSADNYSTLQQRLTDIRLRYLQPLVSQRVVKILENIEPTSR
ncbi:MAG: lipid-A-disaccharide synthase [Planctomycetes bacterium]|nr:lipid-A-disaccharide synthase [Planctomycetota bacterium]